MWPGLVGKGSPGAEPCIDLDTMLDLTAGAEVDGIKFEGVDLFLFEPHINIALDDDGIQRLADKFSRKDLWWVRSSRRYGRLLAVARP